MGTCVCCWGCVQHGCPGNAEECSGPSLPSVVPHHHQETGWQMYIKEGNEQTHPDPIMPYALFVLIGNFLSLCILSILLSPPLWKDGMTTEVGKAFPYFSNTHNLTFWGFSRELLQDSTVLQRTEHSLSSATATQGSGAAPGAQTDPPWLFLSFSQICSEQVTYTLIFGSM